MLRELREVWPILVGVVVISLLSVVVGGAFAFWL